LASAVSDRGYKEKEGRIRKREKLFQNSLTYLRKLCDDIPDRSVGSEGNRMATDFFEKELSSFGWDTEIDEFEAVDWRDGSAKLEVEELARIWRRIKNRSERKSRVIVPLYSTSSPKQFS